LFVPIRFLYFASDPYWKGNKVYDDLPDVFASARILVDWSVDGEPRERDLGCIPDLCGFLR
jgi:hypothetical protein